MKNNIKIKLLYLSGINNTQKYGFYNAVYNRMMFLRKSNNEKINLNFITTPSEDSFFAKILKSILGLPVNFAIAQEESFIENIPLKKSLLDYVLNFFNNNHFEDKLYKTILDICIKRKINFIHVHWAYPYGFVVSKISKEYNIPYVLNVHGSDIHTNPFKDKMIMAKTVHALNNAREVYFVSQTLLDQAKTFPEVTNNAFKVTANGIKIPKRIPEKIEKKLHVCYIGFLTKIKGADRLITIFKKLNSVLPNIKLTIIGEGEYFKSLKQEILENKLNIDLLGYKTNDEIDKLRVNYDLSIIPSRDEGFSLSLLESYVHNIPVIATKCGGMINLIMDKELLIEDDDYYIDNMCNKIIDYYNDKYEAYKLKRNSGKYIEYAKEYNWNDIVKLESEQYKALSKVYKRPLK